MALGDILIITQADLKSGSMRSAEFAKEMGKRIYVLPHRISDSLGTNQLLREGVAEPILDIDSFCSQFGVIPNSDGVERDDFFLLSGQKLTKPFGLRAVGLKGLGGLGGSY